MERKSVFERGEPQFSQTRETVDETPTPDIRLVTDEGDRLTAETLGAKEALALAVEFGDQRLIDQAQDRYDQAVDRLAEWMNAADPRDPLGDVDLDYFPLSDALTLGPRGELTVDQRVQRLEDWRVFLRFIFQDGIKNPWGAFKNLLAVVRRVCPEFLGSISATDLAMIIDETKAATSAREIAFFEDACKRLGVTGYHALGGSKTDKARGRSREAAKGNRNRRTGTRKRKAAQRNPPKK